MSASAVIFDFNGTLSDDAPLLKRLYQELFAAEGITLKRAYYYERLAGLPDPEVIKTVLEDNDRPADNQHVETLLRRKIERYKAATCDEPTIHPEVSAFVHAIAARAPIAIASSAFREEVEHVLKIAGLTDKFQAVVCLEDVENGKPAPDAYLTALRELNRSGNAEEITADQVLVFENSTVGAQAATAAGMRCVAIDGPAYDTEFGSAATTVRALCTVDADALLA